MAGGGGNIDAIKVALGADLTQLRSDLRSAKSDLDKALPKKRTVAVTVNVATPNNAISDLYQNVRSQFEAFQKGAGTNALKIAPRMQVDPRVMRDFRRDIERNMMQAGRAGQALHVPIKFNGDVKGFVASIGRVEVPIYGKWAGWAPGHEPPPYSGGSGGAGGPRPGGPPPPPPRTPPGAYRAAPHSGPAGGGPAPASPRPAPRAAPASGTASAPPRSAGTRTWS